MLYIHSSSCISPQGVFADGRGEGMAQGAFADGVFRAIEPVYAAIPANILRRMSKSVRLGVGAALPLLRDCAPDGILTGTGNGGMEESVKFLRQIIDFKEGILAPGHFVQSIPNAIGSQIGLLSRNRGYNSTYVHKGLGFEHALIDAFMLVKEKPGSLWLVGGVDEVSGYHHRIEQADGWYKTNFDPGQSLYAGNSPGSIAGEGAALFIVDGRVEGSRAKIAGIGTLHSADEAVAKARLTEFLERYLPAGEQIDVLLSGENGDNRALHWYAMCESLTGADTVVARYKHLCGEYPTASAFAVWLACQLEQDRPLPGHLVKRETGNRRYRNILLYNNHKLTQHSFILLQRSH